MKRKKVGKGVLVVLLVLALIVCGGYGYLYFNGLSGIRSIAEAAGGQIKVACVGDSTTYGHGISNWPQNNYPKRLQNLLGNGYCVNNFGVSGYAVQATSDRPYASREEYQQSLAFDGDFVVFMMGTNDTKPENWQGSDAFKTELVALLDSYGDAEVILCTPTAAFFLDGETEGITSHNIQPLVVEEVAQIVRDVAQERGCVLLDIYALTSGHPEWFDKDGVHPNGEGAAAIAQEVYALLTSTQWYD